MLPKETEKRARYLADHWRDTRRSQAVVEQVATGPYTSSPKQRKPKQRKLKQRKPEIE